MPQVELSGPVCDAIIAAWIAVAGAAFVTFGLRLPPTDHDQEVPMTETGSQTGAQTGAQAGGTPPAPSDATAVPVAALSVIGTTEEGRRQLGDPRGRARVAEIVRDGPVAWLPTYRLVDQDVNGAEYEFVVTPPAPPSPRDALAKELAARMEEIAAAPPVELEALPDATPTAEDVEPSQAWLDQHIDELRADGQLGWQDLIVRSVLGLSGTGRPLRRALLTRAAYALLWAEQIESRPPESAR